MIAEWMVMPTLRDDWVERALCAKPGTDPAPWLGDAPHRAQMEAQLACWSCPVRMDCLDSAMAEEKRHRYDSRDRATIRGGLSPTQRKAVAHGRFTEDHFAPMSCRQCGARFVSSQARVLRTKCWDCCPSAALA